MIATLFHDGKNTSIETYDGETVMYDEFIYYNETINHLIKEGFEVKFCIPNIDSYTVWFEKRKEN